MHVLGCGCIFRSRVLSRHPPEMGHESKLGCQPNRGNSMGLSIYALDQRGQGFSSRMLPDREKDYVDDYHRYVTDLEQFIADVVCPSTDARVILLGHSFGGAVAAAYAEKHPSPLTGLILSSPYLGSKAGPFAMFILQTLDFFGMGKEYVPGRGPFHIVPFEKNKETHSRVRHERKMHVVDRERAT